MTQLRIYHFYFILVVACAVNSAYGQIVADTLRLDKIGFKSLFANDTFNPNQPYLSQLSPKAVPFVQEYIRKQGKELTKMKEWGRPYFALYDQILTQYGIPKEMKYLSVIESHLRSGLVSWAGAVGPWQLMDYEAKRFGLKLSPIDERTDYTKSTQVAAKLMKELYEQFGDWLLVVAAYNGGAGRVRQAIRKSGSRDFWDLQYFLKEETRTHVKKFIGTHYLFEGSGGLTTMTKQEATDFKANAATKMVQLLTDQELETTTTTTINGRYNSRIVIKFLDMDLGQFTKWNPDFDKKLSVGENYQLRLAKDKLPVFEARKKEILAESIRMLLEGH
ncbi:lytic transglycosylase domain-containing protein [Parasediminibacterium paludis]|uniref:Lytic transglycosylase domain-containing protein n=1 Tax=Parasediminibacterium paludis TaxID=908966 RepID=A0ABV8PWE0_9BACT